MRFSLRLNNDVPVDRFVSIAVTAEEMGFDQIWVSHDLFWRSAPVLATAAGQATSRIAIGIGVFNPVSMHTAEIAMAAATLNEISQGRALLGIGAGADRFLEWADLKFDSPVRRTRRAILELRALLAGHAPRGWDGEGYLRTGPESIPIYVGAMGPRMLALAGEMADGVLPLLFPPESYSHAVAQIEAGARRAGREVAAIDVAACVWCSIDTDARRATRALAEKIAYFGASFSTDLLARASLKTDDFPAGMTAEQVTPPMLALGIAGTAEQIAERCQALAVAGARHISFGPPLGPDPESAVAALGRYVLPTLR
jgi:5,10-methylenetetrahydromethanopterin reductase